MLAVMLLCTAGLYGLASLQASVNYGKNFGYITKLFDQSYVHTINIEIDDWEAFLETATSEHYTEISVTIDGETFRHVAIRGKGNTSLSTVAQYGNDRYSFKIEFDHYQKGYTYWGLDKLCLNNIIQDNTYMKDYLAYTLMGKMGVPSPLCSYAQILVNGEPWGLYLAVEAVEDAFLARNYGTHEGELYKPDSMSMGGGRGNGRDFDLDAFLNPKTEDEGDGESEEANGSGTDAGEETVRFEPPEGFGGFAPQMPEGMTGTDLGSFDPTQMDDKGPMGGGMGGMGADDVKLIYSDDDPDSYSNIFDNAKTKVTKKDKARLIEAIRKMNAQDTSAIDTEEVIRYLVVHDFMRNDDSYTGSMVHNYYLREYDGVLSMIPWDYNLSIGGFQGASDASGVVNSPIDNPVDADAMASRPMVSWIFDSEVWTEVYHEAYQEFVNAWIASGWLTEEIDRVAAMIDSYVREDPTSFCTYEEFTAGIEALKSYCEKRGESIQGQLDGTIPSTEEGQAADSTNLVDTGDLDLTATGGMNNGGFPGGGGPNMPGNFMPFGQGNGQMPQRPEMGTGERGTEGVPSFPFEGGNGEMPQRPETGAGESGTEGVPTFPFGEGNGAMPQRPESASDEPTTADFQFPQEAAGLDMPDSAQTQEVTAGDTPPGRGEGERMEGAWEGPQGDDVGAKAAFNVQTVLPEFLACIVVLALGIFIVSKSKGRS